MKMEDRKEYNTMMWEYRQAQTEEKRQAINKQFQAWLKQQDPKYIKKLSQRWIEDIRMPNDTFINMLNNIPDATTRASAYLTKTASMSELDRKNLLDEMSKAKLLSKDFFKELNRLQKMDAKR
jgi:uncharacterized membrane-anchored protein YjiN (DUF445 family)